MISVNIVMQVAALVLLLPGLGSACHFFKSNSVIRERAQHKTVRAVSLLDCVRSVCKCSFPCAASYHMTSGRCHGIALLITSQGLAKSQCLLTASTDPYWVTFVSGQRQAPKASVLWLLDSVCKGKNLGIKGSLLQMTTSGVAFPTIGPHGASSSTRYCRLDANTKPEVQVYHGSSYSIDFIHAFTIALWVKTNDVVANMPLLDGILMDGISGNTYGTHFWFYGTQSQNQLCLAHNRFLFSTVNGDERLQWRHVAVTFRGSNQYEMFRNGETWPISRNETTTITKVNPKKIHIGYRGSDIFQGSMACVTIFEQALTKEDIRNLMTLC